MDFLRILKEIYWKLGWNRQRSTAHPQGDSPENLRWNAIRRKLKDIGYQTDKIDILPGKAKGIKTKAGVPRTKKLNRKS